MGTPEDSSRRTMVLEGCLLLMQENLEEALDERPLATSEEKITLVIVGDATSLDMKYYPKLKGQNTKGKAFKINAKKARKDSFVVTGTFLVNNHYAYVLFDTGADLSFVSKQFEPLLGVETINHEFNIDLLPVELGSFDIVVGMDWLSKNGTEIICPGKLVRLPIQNGEPLNIQCDQYNFELKLSGIMKTRKMLRKGDLTFHVSVVDIKVKEQKIDDIPVVPDFPEVFPEYFSGLPPQRQVKFRIDLV
ncbi:uncharacterized protein LOC143556230 [Bidens hawaiensis]|uniref:uncharacterized protein LOC143556230 n=1 Tax=Bidens hawaiensis TaxID=980011 RepID=UPI004049D1EC